MSKERSGVEIVHRVLRLRCEHQIDNTLDEPYVLKCMGVTVSGKGNCQAVDKLEDELNKITANKT